MQIVVTRLTVLKQATEDGGELTWKDAGVDEVPIERAEHLGVTGVGLTGLEQDG